MRIINTNIKSMAYIALLLFIFFCFLAATADAAPQVKTDKDVYGPGETIKVNFFNAPGSSRDWICIAAAGAKDDDAGDYKYMPGGERQGVLTFDAPQPGKYEVRAYYNYSRNGYVVSARYGFTVGATASRAEAVASSTTPALAPEIIKPVEAQAATYSPSGDGPINVAVFHFTPLSMDASHYGITVTNTLINIPKMQSTFIVVNRKDMEIFLAANNLQQSDQIDNMVDIGGRLGMNFVIAGNVIKRGSRIITTYKVASVARRAVIYTNQFTSSGEADLINNITKMSDAIIAAIQRSKY
jgi:TolB-like protein